jgi:hypothetical protein
MATRDQVINVSMTLNTKGFSDGLVLSDKQAKALGKSIANALTLDVKSATNGLKAVNDSMVSLGKTAVATRGKIKDALSFPTTQVSKNVQAVAKELGALQTKAETTARAVNSIRFLIGDTNKNIKSVINNLEKLETVAKRVGTVNVGVNASGSRTASAANTNTLYNTPAGPPRPPTFSKVGSEPGTVFMTPQLRAQQEKEYGDFLDKRARVQFEADKKLATSQTTVTANTTENIKKQLESIPKNIESVGKKSQGVFAQYFSASFFGNFFANQLTSVFKELKDIGEATVLYAARTQELNIVLTSLAKVHNINTQEITNQEEAIKRLNITTQDARETLAKFINVGFDIKSAGPLARVAQDLAVIGNKNTSEELNQLVVAIQTLQSRNLRNAGVFLTVDEVLDKLSATSGRARDSFSTLEKQQALLNAVMEYGGRVAGTYQAAMGTTAKQLRSLDRQFKEAQNAIGQDFVGSLGLAVQASSWLLQQIARYPDVFADAAYSIGLFTVALIALNTQVIQGAYTGLANTFGTLSNSGQAFLNKKELEAAVTAEKQEQLNLERLKIQATQATLAGLLEQLGTEQGITLEMAKQIGLTATETAEIRAEVLALESANAASLRRVTAEEKNTVTAGKAAGFAATVGQVAGVLAVIGIVVTVGKLIYDLATGPYAVGTLDINAILDEAQKTKELEKIKTDLLGNQIELKKADEEISKRITDSRLVDYRVAQAQTTELEKQQKLLLVIDAQIEANRVRGAANKVAASENIFEAASNLTDAQAVATHRASLVLNQTPADENLGHFFGDVFSNITGVAGGLLKGHPFQGLQASETANYVESTKDEQKALAVLTDSLSQAQKVAEAYHVSLQQIIDVRLAAENDKTSESYIKLVNNIKKAVASLKEQEAQELKLQALAPEEKITALIKDFQEKRTAAITTVHDEVISNINKFAATPGNTVGDLDKYGKSQLDYLQRSIQLIDQNFGTNKANLSGFAGNIGAKISQVEQEKGPLTLDKKIAAINEQVKIARNQNPQYIKDLLDIGENFTANTAFVESYLGAHKKLTDELRTSTAELQGFVSQNTEDRKLGFQIEAQKQILSTVQNISKLEFELGKNPSDLRKYSNNIQAARAYEKSLQRQLKLQDDITAARDAQQAVEDEITALKIKITIPAVSAELLAQKQILETIQQRKETEQQLTADIAVEIDKRQRYALTSIQETNRLSAEVFLDAQKSERQTQEDAVKNILGLALQSGDTGAFVNNPLIKEAVKQSEALANLRAQGGVQGQKLEAINVSIKDTSADTNKRLDTINSTLSVKLQELIDKSSGGLGTGAIAGSSGYGVSGGNAQQKFYSAYNRFTAAGVNPNEAKFYASISAAEGGGDVMYGGRPYDPRDTRHPGEYLPGKLGPKGISYAAGPLQITRDNWRTAIRRGLINGDFSNIANQIRVAEMLSGGGAVQAARSGDFARAFALGGGEDWAAIPGSPLPGNKQSISLISSLLGTNLSSPTARVVSQIQNPPAVRGKGSWEKIASEYGLTIEEVNKILGDAPKNSKGLAEIGETAFATAGLLKKFTGNAFATGVTAQAGGNLAKDIKERTDAVNISAAMRNIRTFNQSSIIALESAEEWEKYKTEVSEENNFGASRRATKDAIGRTRLTSLRTRGSTFYNQAYGEATSKRIDDQIALQKELIALEEEGDYRQNNRIDYRQNQARLFYKEQLTQAYSLEDANAQLFERENAYLDENSQLRKNILAQEVQERKAAKQTLREEIDALKDIIESTYFQQKIENVLKLKLKEID